MFHKAIKELEKIRKFVDHRMIDWQENKLLSNNLENVSFELTLAINDLIRVDKVLIEQDLKETIGYVPRPKDRD